MQKRAKTGVPWFGTRRSVVRIHSPRPSFFPQYAASGWFRVIPRPVGHPSPVDSTNWPISPRHQSKLERMTLSPMEFPRRLRSTRLESDGRHLRRLARPQAGPEVADTVAISLRPQRRKNGRRSHKVRKPNPAVFGPRFQDCPTLAD